MTLYKKNEISLFSKILNIRYKIKCNNVIACLWMRVCVCARECVCVCVCVCVHARARACLCVRRGGGGGGVVSGRVRLFSVACF